MDQVDASGDKKSQQEKSEVGGSQVDHLHGHQVNDVGDPEEEVADNQRVHPNVFHLHQRQGHERAEACPQDNCNQDEEDHPLEERQEARQLHQDGCCDTEQVEVFDDLHVVDVESIFDEGSEVTENCS